MYLDHEGTTYIWDVFGLCRFLIHSFTTFLYLCFIIFLKVKKKQNKNSDDNLLFNFSHLLNTTPLIFPNCSQPTKTTSPTILTCFSTVPQPLPNSPLSLPSIPIYGRVGGGEGVRQGVRSTCPSHNPLSSTEIASRISRWDNAPRKDFQVHPGSDSEALNLPTPEQPTYLSSRVGTSRPHQPIHGLIHFFIGLTSTLPFASLLVVSLPQNSFALFCLFSLIMFLDLFLCFNRILCLRVHNNFMWCSSIKRVVFSWPSTFFWKRIYSSFLFRCHFFQR